MAEKKQKARKPIKISFSLNQVNLLSVKSEANTEYDSDAKVLRTNGVISINAKNEDVLIKVFDNVNFKPIGPFSLRIEAVADFRVKCEVPIEKIDFNKNKKLLEKMCEPAFSVTSLVIGFLSEKLICGPPVIFPPFLELGDEGDEEIEGNIEE